MKARPTANLHATIADAIRINGRSSLRRHLGRRPSRHDLEDIEQEVSLHVWKRLTSFDPTRSDLVTFVDRIVRRKLVDLARRRRAQRRQPPTEMLRLLEENQTSGSERFPDGENLTATDLRRHRGVSVPRCDLTALQLDVTGQVDILPAVLGRTSRTLMHYSVSEAAKQLGLSRSTIYAHIGLIRSRFMEAGLAEYP